jgi:feruloyl esterase
MNTHAARLVVAIMSAMFLPSAASAATCDSLASLPVKNGTVTLAQTVAAGAFTPPAGRAGAPGGANVFAKLGEFCRVAVTLKPAPRSDIKAEVWMPTSGWNGKLQVVGNGGFAGTISYPAMANALAAGFAACEHGHRSHGTIEQYIRERGRPHRLRPSRDS